jgi:hypothetical protein
MMAELPPDLHKSTYMIKNDEKVRWAPNQPKQPRRHSFALCVIHRSINAALVDYKARMCQGSSSSSAAINYDKTLNVAGVKKP